MSLTGLQQMKARAKMQLIKEERAQTAGSPHPSLVESHHGGSKNESSR